MPFPITLRFKGGLTASQESVFADAVSRWQEIIIGELSLVVANGEEIRGVRIDVKGVDLDGSKKQLGQAAPTNLRDDSYLPFAGKMEFDKADLTRLEAEGNLYNVVLHEMAHVFGFGTTWMKLKLVKDAGTQNPVFVGQNAMKEFGKLLNTGPTPVPLTEKGGGKAVNSHWREVVFGREIMTSSLHPVSEGSAPISKVTIASLKDLGYRVKLGAADQFTLPDFKELALLGSFVQGAHNRTCTFC